MGGITTIPWTDATANPVTARCKGVAPECDNCYAMFGEDRWHGPGAFISGPPELVPKRLLNPWLNAKMRKAFRIFLMSTSDPFHPGLPVRDLARIWAMMAATPQHEWQVLTKRPQIADKRLNHPDFPGMVLDAMPELIDALHLPSGRLTPLRQWAMESIQAAIGGFEWPLPNVLLGVSVGCQETADKFMPWLFELPARRYMLSAEPLIGDVDLSPYLVDAMPVTDPYHDAPDGAVVHGMERVDDHWSRRQRLNWVIIGGESGRRVRRMEIGWARSVFGQCVDAGVPVFFKQLGSVLAREHKLCDGKGEKDWERWPAEYRDLMVRDFPAPAR